MSTTSHDHQCDQCGRVFRCDADEELGCGGAQHYSLCRECEENDALMASMDT